MIQYEGYFGSVQWVHLNLIIPEVCVHEAQCVVA